MKKKTQKRRRNARPISNEKVIKFTYRVGEALQIDPVDGTDTEFKVTLKMCDDGSIVTVTHVPNAQDFAVGDRVSVQCVYADWLYATEDAEDGQGPEDAKLVEVQQLVRIDDEFINQ